MRRLFAVVLACAACGATGARAQDVVTEPDDSAMRLAPAERVSGRNPSDDHLAMMRAMTDEDITGATELANQLEQARRVAPIDVLWGVGR